jgi:DNA mismatch endonuclease, patch repair protein
MLGNRNRDTGPELAIRRLVHAAGLRYRVATKPLPGMRRTADLVFRPTKVAVFIDGCFWHGCSDHFRPPKTNPEYWREKIGRNKERDGETDKRLQGEGWLVLRFWEHESPTDCAAVITAGVLARRSTRPGKSPRRLGDGRSEIAVGPGLSRP